MQKDSTDALGLENMMGGAVGDSDALDANITLQTQADLLQSDTLALRVIEAQHLEQSEDFKPHFNPAAGCLG